MLMAPSGVDKGSLRPDQLIVVNGQQDVVNGIGRASAETALHRELIQQTGAGSVLHTHSVQATALSQHYRMQGFIPLEGWEMLKGLEGITTHATRVDLPVVANSQSMQDLVVAFHPHLATRAHGILVAAIACMPGERTWPRHNATWKSWNFSSTSISSISCFRTSEHFHLLRHRRHDMSSELCQRHSVSLRQHIA